MANEITNIRDYHLGKGVLYPIQLTKNAAGETGWYPVSGDIKLILNNLQALFSYSIGERFREESFGINLWSLLEEPNTTMRAYIMNHYLKDSLSHWENRISFKNSRILLRGTEVEILIDYTIPGLVSSETLSVTYQKS